MGLDSRSGFVTLEGLEQEIRILLKRITASAGSWSDYKTDSREPTGFVDRTDVSLSFDNGNRRLTVEPAVTNFKFWYQGVEYTKTGAETIDLPGSAEGVHLIYYDADGVLQQIANPNTAQTQTVISNYCLVCYVYFDEDNNLGQLATELHGMVMDNATHLYLHDIYGSQFESGFALGDFVISTGADNEDAQFSVAAGEFHDEDLELAPSAIAVLTGCEIWYRDSSDWRWTTNAGFSVLNNAGDRLYYDNAGVLTEVTDGKYVLCHIFATHLGATGKIVAIMGQAEYSNISNARDGAEVEMTSLAVPDTHKEAIPIATVIFQTKETYGNDVKARVVQTDTGENYVDWRTSALSGGISAGDHGLMAGLLDDDHTQYLLIDGTRAMTGNLTTSGLVSAGADAEVMSIFGRTKIGHLVEAADYALFAHYDNATLNNYALLQGANGTTYINAKDGMPINIRIDNVAVGSFVSWGLSLVSTNRIDLGVAAQIETSIGPNGIVYKNLITSGGNVKHLLWLTDDDDVSQFALGTRTNDQDFLYGFIGTAYTSTWLRYYPTGQVMVGNADPILATRQLEIRRNGEHTGMLIHEDAGTHDAILHLRRGDADWEIINRGNLVIEHEDDVVYTVVRPGTNTISTALTAMSNGDCLLLQGVYTQTVAMTIPTAVTHFSIVGMGMGCTTINFTADVHGFTMSTGAPTDAYRIQQCKLEGFKMTMSAVSSTKTAIYLWGDSSNRIVSPSMIIRDVGIARTASDKYWSIGINIRNAYGVVLDNCFIRTYHSGSDCYGQGVKLESCVGTQIRGGEYFELNKAFNLTKADDALIYGASKHGCEGICFQSPFVVYAEIGIELGTKSLNIMMNNITLDFIMDYGIRELAYDVTAGYHVIEGGWIAADAVNCTADSHLIYLQCPGTTLQGLSITGSATIAINGITITGSTAPVGLAIMNNMIRYCETALYAHKVQDSVFIGNRCSNGQGTYDIILTADADSNLFNANISPKVLFITAGATGNTVTSNKVSSVTDNGTDTILDNNG